MKHSVEQYPTIDQKVELSFCYPVVFTRDLFAVSNDTLAASLAIVLSGEESKTLVFLDDGVAKTHPDLVERLELYFQSHVTRTGRLCHLEIVEGGEQIKNSNAIVDRIHFLVDKHKIDRHSAILAIGGGAVLDAVGFGAATSHRGVRHIRIPSTVLSQNDSGVGVKNGINKFGKKNFVGCFCPPNAVLNDALLLETLENRDWLGGVSEAVKVALLKDSAFFEELESLAEAIAKRDLDAMERVVYRCAELHLDHIRNSGDPFEQGSSRPLDFGHWSAHKLESMSAYDIRHGEAVAIGLCLDCVYSYHSGWIGKEAMDRVLNFFETICLKCSDPLLFKKNSSGSFELLEGLEEFREHLGGKLTIMMLKGIGNPLEVNDVNADLMKDSINYLLDRERSKES